jgi:hypothetical protein
VTGEFTAAGGGTWALIGAEQTASGYEVAWKVAGVDQYTVWNLDSSGNYLSNSIAATSGASAALENVETGFHQDLNGDGVIGVSRATGLSASSQGAAVMAASNDTFVFKPGIGAEFVANAGSTDVIELDGFASVTSSAQMAALLQEAQAGQPQALFHSSADGHDTVVNLGNQDSITLTNVQLADLHASNFIIG